jgi:hypothetical protein
MGVRDDFPLHDHWPAFKDDDFIELFTLRLVHVHNHDASLRPKACREVFLYEGLADDFKGVPVCAIVAPVLGKALPELSAAL